MYTETINKCAANAARINRFERSDKLGFWLSSAMAGPMWPWHHPHLHPATWWTRASVRW